MNKWETVRLGDICNIVSGGTPSRAVSEYWQNGSIPWVKISDMKQKIITNTEEKITETGIQNSSAKILKAGTILYSIFATLGEVSVLGIDATTNQAIAGISTPKNVDKNFLCYFLQSVKKHITEIGRGVAQNNINLTILRALQIPIPPLPEQQAIAAELDTVCDTIAKQKKQLTLCDDLIKSKFNEMFGDPVKNDKGWDVGVFEKVLPNSQYKGKIASNDDKFWLLNLDKVESQTGEILSYDFVEKKQIGNSTITFSTDNVLYSKLRPYLNKAVLPNQTGYATSELLPLKPDSNLLNGYFVTYLLRGSAFVDYIQEKVAGAKMPRVSMDMLRKFNVILPPLPLQHQFADFVTTVEQTKTQIKRSLSETQTLYKTLMQKYFGGGDA